MQRQASRTEAACVATSLFTLIGYCSQAEEEEAAAAAAAAAAGQPVDFAATAPARGYSDSDAQEDTASDASSQSRSDWAPDSQKVETFVFHRTLEQTHSTRPHVGLSHFISLQT